MFRPSRSDSWSFEIAASASASFVISTNPNPRDRPVILSIITIADDTSPKGLNAEAKLSFVVPHDRLPI